MSKSNKNAAAQTRKYQPIWEAISKAKVGDVTSVRVHETAVATLIQAVSKEKSRETAERKRLGMSFAGKLVVRQEPEKDKKTERETGWIIVRFSLEWDGRKL